MEHENATTRAAEIMTAAEVSALLRISRWAVYDMTRRGVLPVLRVGRCCRYVRGDVLGAVNSLSNLKNPHHNPLA